MKGITFVFLFLLIIHFAAAQGIINTIAGNGVNRDSGDEGPAIKAALNFPEGVMVDNKGNIYISDNTTIRKINSSGIITTIAGNGTAGYYGDGGQATAAELNSPNGMCIDAKGNLYIADVINCIIRKLNPTTGIIRTVAGIPQQAGYGGDGGQATNAGLKYPEDVCIDRNGNIYIADRTNNRIRKVDTSGTITTVAGIGQPSFGGDSGLATAANLYYPYSVCTDTNGNLYIADTYNSRIRKVDALTGIIYSIAGLGSGPSAEGYSGDEGPATAAELNMPTSVRLDSKGNVYIADESNNRIRMIDAFGTIKTVAGTGVSGFSGDGNLAIWAELSLPFGIAIDSSEDLYLTDFIYARVREVTAPVLGISTIESHSSISLYPNPNNGKFTLQTKNVQLTSKNIIEIYNMLGEKIYSGNLNLETTEFRINTAPSGIYLYRIITKQGEQIATGKFVIE